MSDEARVTPDVGLSRRAPGAHPPTQLDPRVGIAKGAAKAFKLPSLDSLTDIRSGLRVQIICHERVKQRRERFSGPSYKIVQLQVFSKLLAVHCPIVRFAGWFTHSDAQRDVSPARTLP